MDNASSLNQSIQGLQQDAIALLGQIEGLMARASQLLSSDASGEKYAEFQSEIVNAKQNVDSLELVMAIVAPMKAGKSTIINAIVGQDILPSRASAMTTLPTEILLRDRAGEPTLKLDKNTLLCLKNTLSLLQNKIVQRPEEWVAQRMEKYPHLIDLIPKIRDGLLFHSETRGLKEIKETLTGLNDIVRVCSVLDPFVDPLNKETFNIPCLDTPFRKVTETPQSRLLGNLVIVDTPGPNEAGENLKLCAVVEEQLRRSSMVLVVLDFTQLNNKAAEEIKRQVQPVVRLLGKENLYVLVNKVDQRTEQDPMTPEKVRQFVLADLGLGESNDGDRIFEVAARRAFCAANFLSELQNYPNIQKEEMATARPLAEQVFGIDWEEELEDCSLEQLQKKAQRLWKKSGFEPFLDNAINALMGSAAPRCIKSAMNLSCQRLEELKDDVQLRSSAIAQDEAKLRLEIGALEKDIANLESCRSRLKEVETLRNNLRRSLDELLEELKKTAKLRLEDYFKQKDYERSNPIQKMDIVVRGRLAAPLSDLKLFPDWISQKFRSLVEYKTSEDFEFSSESEAEEFASQAVAYAKERADSLMVTVREQANCEIQKARSGLIRFLRKETSPIIERARTRLNQSFNITLSLPHLVFDLSGEISINRPRIKSQTETVSQGYETVTVMKRVWWHWLWMLPVEVVETRKRPDKRINYYTVSLNELISEINQSIESSIEVLEKRLTQYIDEDFQARVNVFFDDLDGYLSNYRDSLNQAQSDRQLAAAEQETLIQGLNSIVPEATEQIEKCRAYVEYANSLLDRRA